MREGRGQRRGGKRGKEREEGGGGISIKVTAHFFTFTAKQLGTAQKMENSTERFLNLTGWRHNMPLPSLMMSGGHQL